MTRWVGLRGRLVSWLETLRGMQQRLVLLPGQYRGSDAQERVYQQVQVSLYASTSGDWDAPTITSVVHLVGATSAVITVMATDEGALASGICTG